MHCSIGGERTSDCRKREEDSFRHNMSPTNHNVTRFVGSVERWILKCGSDNYGPDGASWTELNNRLQLVTQLIPWFIQSIYILKNPIPPNRSKPPPMFEKIPKYCLNKTNRKDLWRCPRMGNMLSPSLYDHEWVRGLRLEQVVSYAPECKH